MATSREILADPGALATRAAQFIVDLCAEKTGRIAISLSGGSTPKRLYELLATPTFRDNLPWDRIHWFWGDERFVPADHPDSNYRMVRLALFASVPVFASNIHPIRTDLPTPQAAASAYQTTLQAYYGADRLDSARPLFDLTLLGLGEDGHTASLFPGTAALAERQDWVTAVIGAKPEPRISLTYPVIDASRETIFLVAGKGKQEILRQIAAGADLPAAHVKAMGTLHWMLDRDAAGEE